MRVAVTGASGNVGLALLRRLESEPGIEEVVALARRPPSGQQLRSTRVRWFGVDVTRDDVARHLRGCDGLVHLAWRIWPHRERATLRSVNVDGSARVFAAAVRAKVKVLVHASSVGAYSAGPKDSRVDETWATEGSPTSQYSREKAEVERLLDGIEGAAAGIRVVRMRPGLIFQRDAASEIARYFLGPLFPRPLARRHLLPVLPLPPDLAVQAVHADDVAAAYVSALLRDVSGAFNLAAEPVLHASDIARLLGARLLPLPARALRTAAAATFRLHLQPTEPGWLDLAMRTPLLDTDRARTRLGWAPQHDAGAALLELVDAMANRVEGPTPVLEHHPPAVPR